MNHVRFIKYFFPCLLISPINESSADMLDYYMMGVIPSIVSQYETVIAPTISSDSMENLQSHHDTTVNMISTLKRYTDSNFELSGVASNDFTQSIDSYDMSYDELKLFHEKLTDNLPRMAAVLLYTYHLNALETNIPASTLHTSNVSVKPRIAFTTVALLAGIAYGVQQAASKSYSAIQSYAQNGEDTIANAQGEELKHLNTEVLGLNENATAQEAVAKYRSFGFMKKAKLTLHDITRINSTYGDDEMMEKSRTSFADMGTKITKEGIVLTVGTSTSVIGGQGIDKLATAAGASANVAAGIDLLVTVSGNQPLDYVVAATESKEKTEQTIPASSMNLEEAVNVLNSLIKKHDIDIEDAIEATNKIANETARRIPDAVINPDGSVTALVSDLMDLRLIETLEDEDVLTLRDIDNFDLLIMAEDKYPEKLQVFESNSTEEIAIDAIEIPQCSMTYDLVGTFYPNGQSGDYVSCTYSNYSGTNGLSRERHYVEGSTSVEMTYWSNSWTDQIGLLYHVRYFNGSTQSGISYHQSGRLWGIGDYDSVGRKNGKHYTYNDNPENNVAITTEYLADQKHGQEIYYYYNPDSQTCYLYDHDTYIGACE